MNSIALKSVAHEGHVEEVQLRCHSKERQSQLWCFWRVKTTVKKPKKLNMTMRKSVDSGEEVQHRFLITE